MRQRRLTIWGVGEIFVLVLLPALTLIDVIRYHLAILPTVLRFGLAAVVGWLFLTTVFRLLPSKLAWLVLALGSLVAIAMPWFGQFLAAGNGVLFGAAVAWWPHCWAIVGVKSSDR